MDDRPVISRRDLLRGAGLLGVASAAGLPIVEVDAAGAGVQAQPAARAREVFEQLSASEGDLVEAIVARLVPSDGNGPGAREARAARYIDRALGGALAGSRDAYRSGLAALDDVARSSRGAAFAELPPDAQDAVLAMVERGDAPGFAGGSAAFFTMVRTHTLQGTFGDPHYGGNANYIGWDLIGYPGVRTAVSAADQQRLERGSLEPNHRSAYDTDMFTKASARAAPGGGSHGD